MKQRKNVVVIGAGPMGLACGYEMAKAGHAVTVLEAGDRIGGMSASFDFAGLTIERFYHFICSTDYPLFALLDEVGLTGSLRWKDTEMGFYYQGSLYGWGRPDHLLRFPHLDLVSKVRFALHVLYCKRITDWTALDRVEASSWIKRWIGERAYEVLWDKLFRLKFFEYSENLSAAWIGARVARVARSRKNLFTESLGYLEGGSQVLIQKLAARIADMGGRVDVNMPVSRIVTAEGRVRGVQVKDRTLPCDTAISTIPLAHVAKMAPDLNDAELEKVRQIRNIGVVCVLLKLKRALSRYFWMNTNDERMAIPGVIEYTNLNPLAHHVVYVPFYMPQTHPRYERPANEFVAEVMGYVKRINPDLEDDWVLASHVSRYQFAQPVCTPGFFSKLPPLRSSIGGFLMADTSFYYPEDRSISESVLVGRKLAVAADENS